MPESYEQESRDFKPPASFRLPISPLVGLASEIVQRQPTLRLPELASAVVEEPEKV